MRVVYEQEDYKSSLQEKTHTNLMQRSVRYLFLEKVKKDNDRNANDGIYRLGSEFVCKKK